MVAAGRTQEADCAGRSPPAGTSQPQAAASASHLASVGCPVVGDKLYGPDDRLLARAADGQLTDDDWPRLELPRHALHSHRYTLPHAITGEALDLVSPLPPGLVAFWNGLPCGSQDA